MALNTKQQAELDRICRSNPTGRLQPPEVVKAARKPTSPLHNCFTWDDTKAAHEFRLMEARQLIEVYIVSLPEGNTRGYISLRGDRQNGAGYLPVADAMNSESTRALLVQQMSDDLRAVLRRYAYLKPIAPTLFKAIEKLLGHEARQGTTRPALASRGTAAQA